jgi:hypothetical protein
MNAAVVFSRFGSPDIRSSLRRAAAAQVWLSPPALPKAAGPVFARLRRSAATNATDEPKSRPSACRHGSGRSANAHLRAFSVIDKLPESSRGLDMNAKQTEVLVAEGRSYRWIARDLSLSKNAVAAIVGRARMETAPDIETAE